MTPPLRRAAVRRLFAGGLVVALVTSLADRPVAAADDAATVNGTSISVDELDATIESFAAQGVLGLSIDPNTNTVLADAARTTLTVLIQNQLGGELLESLGIAPMNDADRDEQFQAVVDQQPQFGELDAHGQDVVKTSLAQFQQLDDVTLDDLGDMRDRYEASPVSLGVVCAELFTATDEQAAVDAVNALADGVAFTDVESQYGVPDDTVQAETQGSEPVETAAIAPAESADTEATADTAATAGSDPASTEPASTAPTGTAATASSEPASTEPASTEPASTAPADTAATATTEPGGSSPFQCTPIRGFATLGSDVTAPLLEAEAGEAIVLRTDAGDFVLDIGAYDEVAEPLEAILASPPTTSSGAAGTVGQLLFDGWVATADVSVNPRYGRWDPLSGSVVALNA